MHPSTPNRKIQTLVVSVIALVPFICFCLTFIGWKPQLGLWLSWFTTPVVVGGVVISLVAIVGMIWWKQTAAMPEIVLIPFATVFIFGFAAASRHPSIQPPMSEPADRPPVMNVSGEIDGTDVWCNGVLLGQTPLKLSLESFYEKVQPVDEPPEQQAIVYSGNAGISFRDVSWSATPYDPAEFDERGRPESNSAIMEKFKGQKYWWTFRNGEFLSLSTRISGGGNASEQRLSSGSMKTLKRHAQLLKLLAKHEGVAPLVAYATHIEKHPALKQAMTKKEDHPKTDKQPDLRRLLRGHLHSGLDWADRLSGTMPDPDISFEEAVWRQDWLTIARSDNPKSVPLLKRMLQQALDRYSGSVLTFSSNTVLILMQSPHEEIKSTVRDIMETADWTNLDLIKYYIDQELSSGADPSQLTNWISKRKNQLHTNFETLVIRIGAENLPQHIGSVSDLTWVPNEVRDNPPEVLLKWLIDQWKNNRSVELASELQRLAGNQEILSALADTDLSNADKTNELRRVVGYFGQSETMRQALSEAAAEALSRASEKEHIEALMRVFESLPTETSLAALESFRGPKIPNVEQTTRQIRNQVAANKKRFEADLQLARDLIAGTKNPSDLVATKRFIWQDGRYVSQ